MRTVSADMIVGWVGLFRRKTYLDSSRGLIAMTMFGERSDQIRCGQEDGSHMCRKLSLGRKWQLMKGRVSKTIASTAVSSASAWFSRLEVVFFPPWPEFSSDQATHGVDSDAAADQHTPSRNGWDKCLVSAAGVGIRATGVG